MTEVKKPEIKEPEIKEPEIKEPEVKISASDKFKVKNVSKNPINLTSGCLGVQKQGVATRAELTNFEGYIEKV